jgi:hypothetical protein
MSHVYFARRTGFTNKRGRVPAVSRRPVEYNQSVKARASSATADVAYRLQTFFRRVHS